MALNSIGQSLRFNGLNNYVNLTNDAALQLQNFTLEAWIKIEGSGTATGTGVTGFEASTVVPIISKGSDESGVLNAGINYFLGYRPSDMKLVADFQDNSTLLNHPVISKGSLMNCSWIHVAASYDLTLSTWKLYINGLLDTSVVLSGTFIPDFLSSDSAAIGTTLNSAGIAAGFFQGKIDEVRIWNIVRTDEDISNNYKTELSSATGLVASYSFNEGSGVVASNSVSATSNGSLINDPEWTNGFNQSTAIKFNGINNYIAFGKSDGTSGTDNLNAASFTLEAWIKPEGTGVATTTGNGGITAIPIITKGRVNGESPSKFNINYFLGIDANKKLVADFEDSLGANHPIKGKAVIPDSNWTHVAATYDSATSTWKLYVNGVLDTSKIIGNNIYPVRNSIEQAAIGSALTSNNSPQGFFSGKIDEVRIWKIARTDPDILSTYTQELSSGTGLIAKWGLGESCGTSITNTISSKTGAFFGTGPSWTKGFSLPPILSTPTPANNGNSVANNTNLCVNVSDPENDNLKVRFFGRKKPSKKFTIVLLPDTQYYTAQPQGTNGGSNEIFKSETNWIVNNRAQRNIVYVGHLGDCSQNGDKFEVEWQRADTAIRPLEDQNLTGLPNGIPYGICVGNHDQTPTGNPTGTTTLYNQYFGSSRFSGRSYYGNHFGSNNDNFYDTFSVGNLDFLVIYFEYDQTTAFSAPGGALDWGENLVKSYPNRNVIVLSHWVLNANSTVSFSPQGKAIYNRLKIYPNFKLMSGGHVIDAGEAVRVSTYKGNTVYTIVSNYQTRANGGYGLFRIYEFNPDSSNVAVQTYSPWIDAYETDANSQFNMNVKLITNPNYVPTDTFHLIGELDNVSSGSNPCISWPSLEANSNYEWYVDVSDGENKITSPIWSFTATQSSNLISTNKNTLKSQQFLFSKSAQSSSKESFTLYPNPNNTHQVTISFNEEVRGKVSIEIMNMLGNVLLQKTVMNAGNKINFYHNLSPGTYTVLVQMQDRREVRKLIVVK